MGYFGGPFGSPKGVDRVITTSGSRQRGGEILSEEILSLDLCKVSTSIGLRDSIIGVFATSLSTSLGPCRPPKELVE